MNTSSNNTDYISFQAAWAITESFSNAVSFIKCRVINSAAFCEAENLLQFRAVVRQQVIHMADQNTSTLKVLNDLIATCHDSEEGYAKAAKGVHDQMLSDQLASISGQRDQFASELGKIVSDLGGQPATDAHYGGILHSGWVDLETRIRPKNEHDMLQDCQRGDQGTLRHYQQALDHELPPEVHAVVERQRNGIQSDLDALENHALHRKGQHA